MHFLGGFFTAVGSGFSPRVTLQALSILFFHLFMYFFVCHHWPCITLWAETNWEARCQDLFLHSWEWQNFTRTRTENHSPELCPLELLSFWSCNSTVFPSLIQSFSSFQEKVKGKNKLVPRLLGVNKDSVVRVDLQTKEVSNKGNKMETCVVQTRVT